MNYNDKRSIYRFSFDAGSYNQFNI